MKIGTGSWLKVKVSARMRPKYKQDSRTIRPCAVQRNHIEPLVVAWDLTRKTSGMRMGAKKGNEKRTVAEGEWPETCKIHVDLIPYNRVP